MLALIKWYLLNEIVKTGKSILLLSVLQIVSLSVFAQREFDHPFGNKFQFDVFMRDKGTMIPEPVYVPISDKAIYQIFEPEESYRIILLRYSA